MVELIGAKIDLVKNTKENLNKLYFWRFEEKSRRQKMELYVLQYVIQKKYWKYCLTEEKIIRSSSFSSN
ncbi:hypothetical protein AUO94_08840 [Planococcus kocurii]|uniref:Uncharacterized protein n=1 Tax=Planococcus kocurii TaxID=1374 RepID=A0ABN4JVK6_9BACL|nr:hypothetical protein AUO94_08840 [Planococcus kocurii]